MLINVVRSPSGSVNPGVDTPDTGASGHNFNGARRAVAQSRRPAMSPRPVSRSDPAALSTAGLIEPSSGHPNSMIPASAIWHPGAPVAWRQFAEIGDIELESGQTLPQVRMAYESWGKLNAAKDNAVLVLHALTGDGHVVGPTAPGQPTPGWWEGLIGRGATLDTDELFIIAPNVLGGCQGTTGPSSIAPDGKPYGSRFPTLSIRDQVAAEAALADQLGIDSYLAVVGGSMGGMRVVEWAVSYPDRVRAAIALATCAYASADQIGWTTPQLAAIRSDQHFVGGDYYGGEWPLAGQAIAREIAHMTYRSEYELNARFGRDAQQDEDPTTGGRYAIESYIQYHGAKLGRRFDPNSYLILTEAMNSHDIGRGRGGVAAALALISAELTVAVVDSDRLFPPPLGAELVDAPTARPLITMHSEFGHDGFLIEADQVAAVVADAVARVHSRAVQR